MILILAQLALLFLTAWGWGFWLWKVSRAGRCESWKRHGGFFFGLAGFMACILFLHTLIYLNLPLKHTAWAGFLVAAAGAITSGRTWFRRGHPTRRGRREIVTAGLLFATVFGFQSVPLFLAGPANYYGSAHTDQVNYVLQSEFLIEEPLTTSLDDIGLHPWLAKALALKEIRKGQGVAVGYLGVVSLVDAKRAYGTLSIFMVGVGALSVFVLARVLSVPRTLAWLVGVWWGVLPAITKLHLDGFLSQACVLFVFPAMAAVFHVRRGRLELVPLLLLAIYLAYLLCTYTEVYLIGLGLLCSLAMFGVPTVISWWSRAVAVIGVVVGSLLLNTLYLRDFIHYTLSQYEIATSVSSLSVLTPLSGTWLGWKQVFFGYTPLPDAKMERLSILVGFALLFLIACAFQYGGLARRRFLLAVVAPPAGALAVLLSAPEFSKYPFSKLVDTFTTFWLVLAVVGVLSLRGILGRGRLSEWLLGWPTVGLLVIAAFCGSWPQWRETWEDRGILSDVDSPGARRCYAQAQHDPNAVYLIDEANNLVCAWLAYAARHSQVYVAVDQITDQPIPASVYAFRRTPPPSPNLTILDEKGPMLVKDRAGLPTFVVKNPQGIEGGAEHTFYWLGPDATLTLSDYSATSGQTRLFSLKFTAIAGPANPTPERSMVLIGPDGSEQKLDFVDRTTSGRFQVKVHAGDNVYKLKITRPTEQTVKFPSDPRNLMVRLQELTLDPLDNPKMENP